MIQRLQLNKSPLQGTIIFESLRIAGARRSPPTPIDLDGRIAFRYALIVLSAKSLIQSTIVRVVDRPEHYPKVIPSVCCEELGLCCAAASIVTDKMTASTDECLLV